MKNTKRIASSRKYYCQKSFKQEAPLKGNLTGGAESVSSTLDLVSDEKIDTEVLQIEFEIMKQANSHPGMHGGKAGITIRLWKYGQSGPAVILTKISNQSWDQPEDWGPTHTIYLISKVQMEVTSPQDILKWMLHSWDLRVPQVGFLVVKDPSDLLQTKKKTKLPGIISWNLIKLAYQEFVRKYPVEVFNSFQCPQNVDPLLFSQLCVYYYTDVRPAMVNKFIKGDCVYTESIATNLNGEVVYKKTPNFYQPS